MFLLQIDEFDKQTIEPYSPSCIEQLLGEKHHFSYNPLKGANSLGTLKFKGQLQGVMVQILVDNNSDKFIQSRVAHFLKLLIELATRFKVLVGNDNTMNAKGYVKDIQVKIQNHVLYLSAFLLPIAGADLVLRTSWLATLGPHVADFSNLTLNFYMDGDCSSNILLSFFRCYCCLSLEGVAMDFITELSNSFGFMVSMVVVDFLSKYGHFTTLKTYYNSRMVA